MILQQKKKKTSQLDEIKPKKKTKKNLPLTITTTIDDDQPTELHHFLEFGNLVDKPILLLSNTIKHCKQNTKTIQNSNLF